MTLCAALGGCAGRLPAGAAVAALACDWGQTRVATGEGRREVNPVLGPHPRTAAVDAYFAVAAVALVAATRWRWGRRLAWVVAGAEVAVASRNLATTGLACGF